MWGLKLQQKLLEVCYLAILATWIVPLHSATAAEKIKFNYGMGSQSITLEELETFAETGEISPGLDFLFKFTGHNPEMIRLLLVQEVPVDAVTASNLLNNPIGGYILDRVSNVVHSGASEGNSAALRGTIITSSSSDRKISLLELWRNYPTKEVNVEGKAWTKITEQFSNTLEKGANKANLSPVIFHNFLNTQ